MFEVSTDFSDVVDWLHITGGQREAAHKVSVRFHCMLLVGCSTLMT